MSAPYSAGKVMTTSQRATLARTRISAACGGDHTAEFKQWTKRSRELTRELMKQRDITKPAARQHSWLVVEKEFEDKRPDRASMMLGFFGKDKRPRSLIEDVRWAYRHAMIFSTTEMDAPSAGAWLWLLEARENRSQFLGKLFALEQATHGGKLPEVKKGASAEEETEEQDEGADVLESLFGRGQD